MPTRIRVIPPMTESDAQMIADEGAHKMKTYGCTRAIVVHRMRAYMIEKHGPRPNGTILYQIFDDIDRIVGIVYVSK